MKPADAIPFRGTEEGNHGSMDRSPVTESFYHLMANTPTRLRCQGTACFVARHPGASTAPDTHPSDPRVYCHGTCFDPAGTTEGHKRRPRIEIQSSTGIVLERLVKQGAQSLETYRSLGGYRGLHRAMGMEPDKVIRELETSNLRGRGGAAYPTGKKWRAVSNQEGTVKHIVANADEGDPGAYIDRFLMEEDPFALIEGMTIAARAIGAAKGWIYLRAEYPDAASCLTQAISEARNAHLLGEQILGQDFSFDVEIVIGQGSYICGEETAMLNSIEGRRPDVRARPPYPTSKGLWGRPTLVNNVETFANVHWILINGGTAYREFGFSQSRGTKLVSLNSLFNRPGLYEIDFGIDIRHLVEGIGGGLREDSTIKGVIIGGPLAGIIPPQLFDTQFGFEELQSIGASVGHGGVIGFDSRTSIAELIHHVFSFGAYESCGKCVPCREGSRRIEQIFFELIRSGRTGDPHLNETKRIISALKLTSLCGLGTGLAEFIESALRHYGSELKV